MRSIIFCQSVSKLLIISMLSGCVSGAPKYTSSRPDFQAGLAAISNKDFKLAAYHFSELAKEGSPSAMNNLGVALLMVGREDDAFFWFSKASRYGDANARITLAKFGYAVPPADLVGKHPAQLQKEATEQFVQTAMVGLLIGVSIYAASKSQAHGTPATAYGTPATVYSTESSKAASGFKCHGYSGPGGPCYAGPGGGAYTGPGGGAYAGPGGPAYAGPGGGAYAGPGGGAYAGPGGPAYTGPGGGAYAGPGGPCYTGPGGACYTGPGGGAYNGPGGMGGCPKVCQ